MNFPQLRAPAFATLLLTAACFAQSPNAPPLLPKPVNLQVLPKDTPAADVFAMMKEMNGQLGVQCVFCHVADAATHHLNFASDDKPQKATARIMMSMTNELNDRYISKLPEGSGQKVACGTCHRGHSMPEEFVPAPAPPEHH